MEILNKKNNNNSINHNNKSKLVNFKQNKEYLTIKIENYFSKSNLKSIENSCEKKVREVKELLMEFHLLYNSLNKIKTYKKIKNIPIFNPIISERNPKQKLLLFNKKNMDKNKESINKEINNYNLNNLNLTKKEEKKIIKNNSINKPIKSFRLEKNKNNNLFRDNLNIKTENSINGELNSKKMSEKKIDKVKKKIIYNFNSNENKKIKKTKTINCIINSNSKFNEHKTTNFDIKNSIESKSINKDKNNKSIKRLTFSLKSNHKINENNLYPRNTINTLKKNYNKILNQKIYYKRNKNFNIDLINKINLSEKNKNFSSENILFSSKLNFVYNHNFNNSNTIKNENKLQKYNGKEIKYKINKSYKFEQKYNLRKNNIQKNRSLINNKIIKKRKIYEFNLKNNSNILFTKEKRSRQLKKQNIFFLFLTNNKNYYILKKIYNYLYINENIKEGNNNYLKNIKGPFRDIYLKKCLSNIQNKLDKYKDKNKEKDDDILAFMEKEILIHNLNKLNKFIENNNYEI